MLKVPSLKCESSPISHPGIRLRAGDDLHFRLECTLNCKIGDSLHSSPVNDEIKDNENPARSKMADKVIASQPQNEPQNDQACF